MAFIEACGVSKSFVGGLVRREVLAGVDLRVERGEFVAIVGPMGCGKSTLLSLLAGLVPADAGTVTIDGEAVTGVREDTAIVFQNYSLLPWLSALENVRLAVGATWPSWTREAQRAQATKYLDLVGLGNSVHKRPRQLSGGMRQRVAIARAFATEPAVLFLDEPFGALDALTRGTLQQELAAMCATGDRPVTTVMISNSVDEAILLADRVIPMQRGPRARLGTAVPVPLGRPRSSAALEDEHADRVRARIIAKLTAEALGRPAATTEVDA